MDIPTEHPHYSAIEFLQENGILTGYPDPTSSEESPQFLFKPTQIVNRAEVTKIIVGRSASTTLTSTGSSFSDVPATAWYSVYVETAFKKLRSIDGPPTTTLFKPNQSVTRAEFLKMLFLAEGVNPFVSYNEITFPLSLDVTSAQVWYYPYMRYGLTVGMLDITKGNLEPAAPLEREDIAEMLYRFLLYQTGKQTQTLLSSVENNVLDALQLIEGGNPSSAQYSAARAILAARGALASKPNDATTKAAVKTAEGTMALAKALEALQAQKKDDALTGATTAWHLGAKGMEFSSALRELDAELQQSATAIADKARGLP